MKKYEWMVNYTPQKEWIEKRGILLWLAFFFIELGAGMFLIASVFDSLLAMVIGWILCGIVGGGLHLLYLGRKSRFFRMVLRPQTSWISRGLIFVFLFLIFGIVHVGLSAGAKPVIALIVIADIFAFLTIIYGGFAMNFVNGIQIWNTALLPVLYLISGLWGGAEVTLGIVSATGMVGAGAVIEEWIRILVAGFVLFIPIYLISVRYTSLAGKISVRLMTLGRWSPLFWIAVVGLGIVIPLAAVVNSSLVGFERSSLAFMYIAIFSGLVGDLAMRYLILKCGLYSPLIPSYYVNMPDEAVKSLP